MKLRSNGKNTDDIREQISQLTDNGETAAIVVLTQSEYNALTPDANTLYLITEDA